MTSERARNPNPRSGDCFRGGAVESRGDRMLKAPEERLGSKHFMAEKHSCESSGTERDARAATATCAVRGGQNVLGADVARMGPDRPFICGRQQISASAAQVRGVSKKYKGSTRFTPPQLRADFWMRQAVFAALPESVETKPPTSCKGAPGRCGRRTLRAKRFPHAEAVLFSDWSSNFAGVVAPVSAA